MLKLNYNIEIKSENPEAEMKKIQSYLSSYLKDLKATIKVDDHILTFHRHTTQTTHSNDNLSSAMKLFSDGNFVFHKTKNHLRINANITLIDLLIISILIGLIVSLLSVIIFDFNWLNYFLLSILISVTIFLIGYLVIKSKIKRIIKWSIQ